MDVQAYLARYRRRNFLSNALVMSFYSLGASFVFPATVMTVYAGHLTDSAVLIGLIPALFMVGMNLPQLFFARIAEQPPLKRPLILKLAFLERVPYLAIGISILLLPNAPPPVAYTVLIVGLVVAASGGGMLQPVWKAMLTKLIEPNRRGLMFGLGQGFGGVLGALGALGSAAIMNRLAYPYSFGVLFLLAAAAHAGSWCLLAFNREPPVPTTRPPGNALGYFRELPALLRNDVNFSRYLVSQVLVVFALMGVNFYVLYAQDLFPLTAGFVGTLTMASMIGVTVGVRVIGVVADRWGNKVTAIVSLGLLAAAVVVLLAARHPGWLPVAFACMSIGQTGVNLSRTAITMEFSDPEKVPTYTGITGTFIGPMLFVAPILGGRLLDSHGFIPLFGIILTVTVAAALFLMVAVREPRRQ